MAKKETSGIWQRWVSNRGTAAIEFALAAPAFVILITGVVELGFSIKQEMNVQNAAEAGALYAAEKGWNSAAISAAVLSATGGNEISASPAPQQFCGCPTASGVTATTCGGTCAGGNLAGTYIQVSASTPRLSILPDVGLGLPSTLTGQAVVRSQ